MSNGIIIIIIVVIVAILLCSTPPEKMTQSDKCRCQICRIGGKCNIREIPKGMCSSRSFPPSMFKVRCLDLSDSEMCCCAFSNGYNNIETISECKKNGGNCHQQSVCGV